MTPTHTISLSAVSLIVTESTEEEVNRLPHIKDVPLETRERWVRISNEHLAMLNEVAAIGEAQGLLEDFSKNHYRFVKKWLFDHRDWEDQSPEVAIEALMLWKQTYQEALIDFSAMASFERVQLADRVLRVIAGVEESHGREQAQSTTEPAV